MKRFFALYVSLSALVWLAPSPARAADASEETQLIGVLQSTASAQDKSDACARLKWIGTASSVPALATLLTDPELSHSARYALETIKGEEAEKALCHAVAITTGSNQAGVILTLGVRGDEAAVPELAKQLANADADVAVASASALGTIGGKNAAKDLQQAWDGSAPGRLHDAQADGLLACANRWLTRRDDRAAEKIFQALYDHETSEGIRLAAFRGVILSSGKHGLVLMVQAIADEKSPAEGAALQLASKLGGPATTLALANLLPKLSAAGQIAVLFALEQRGDRSAQPAIAMMLRSEDVNVRLAAIAALGELGDGQVAVMLAHRAAVSSGAEKAASRQALVDLRHGQVADELVKALATAPPDMQGELIRALSERGDTYAAPKLLELAQSGDDSVRSAALQGLAVLSGPPQIPGLIRLVVNATNDDARSEVADTLTAACQHIQAQGGKIDAAALAEACQTGAKETRAALLGVCSGLSEPQIRAVLRAAVTDSDPALRAAGLRALCESQDEELLPDMVQVATQEKAVNFRVLGFRGAVRLLTQEQFTPMPAAQKLATLKELMPAAFNAETKRLVLSGLATVPDPQALTMTESLLDDADVKVEAGDATVQIARTIAEQEPKAAAAALQRVLAAAPEANVRKSAQAVLRKIKVVD